MTPAAGISSKPKVLNMDFLKDTEGNRVGYPKRTYSAGSYLGGYSDHFPTEILLRRSSTKNNNQYH